MNLAFFLISLSLSIAIVSWSFTLQWHRNMFFIGVGAPIFWGVQLTVWHGDGEGMCIDSYIPQLAMVLWGGGGLQPSEPSIPILLHYRRIASCITHS